MFGSLKKKLQEAVKRVSGSVEKPLEKQEELLRTELPKQETAKVEHAIEKNEPLAGYHLLGEEKVVEEIAEEKAKRPFIEKGAEAEIQNQPSKTEKTFETAAEKTEEACTAIEEKIEKISEKKGIFEIFRKKSEDSGYATHERVSVVSRLLEKELSGQDVAKILRELETAMLENDVAVEVAEKISLSVKSQLVGIRVRRGEAENTIKQALRNAMTDAMQQKRIDLGKMIEDSKEPLLVMMLGFNGVGKTTTLAKIASRFREFNPILAAGDTFRAASIEQLEVHSRRLNARLIKSKYGADSAAVIFDAVKHASASGSKLVLADTAGRSHTNVNLMDELRKVVRVNNPGLKILVLDSLAGNDIYEQARLFDEAVGVDAVILTKSDVYDRGGAALSAAYALKKPILYLGTGQEYEDLVEFDPEKIAGNLL